MKRNWELVLKVLELAELGELASFKKDTVEGMQYHVDLCKQQGLLDEDLRLTWPGHDELFDRRERARKPIGFRAAESQQAESGRAVLTHRAPGLNEMLRVEALGEPGRGGANQVYRISGEGLPPTELRFQTGAVCDVGLLGVSNEAVLAVIHDRLHGFQGGSFACEENDIAISGIATALEALNRRTMARHQAAPDPAAESGGPAGGKPASQSKSQDKRLSTLGADFTPSGQMSAEELEQYRASEKQSSGPLPPTDPATPAPGPAAQPAPAPA